MSQKDDVKMKQAGYKELKKELNDILKKYSEYCDEQAPFFISRLSQLRKSTNDDKQRELVDFAVKEISITKKQLNDSLRRIQAKWKDSILEKEE